jgi:REP element-mobilizing transposase RayT
MNLIPDSLYHIYNRGNNRQLIFFQKRNYEFFLKKASHELGGQLEFLAYCLMPNHFHFLVSTKSDFDSIKFSNAFRTLLSSYTRAIQKQENMTGSLFQQNTKAKELTDNQYAFSCFHYIHQNPYRSILVDKIEDWPYHSFHEYWKNSEGICNAGLGRSLITIAEDSNYFYKESYSVIPDQLASEIF